MSCGRSIAGVFGLVILCAGATGQPDEYDAERALELSGREFFDHVFRLCYVDDETRLDELAQTARETGARRPWGDWVLDEIYGNIGDHYETLSTQEARDRFRERFEGYIEAHPDSITYRTILVSLLTDEAWIHRGSGYADTVTPEGWRLFGRYIRQAKRVADEAMELEQEDPALYRTMLTLGMADGDPVRERYGILEKGLTGAPTYYHLVTNMAYSLLPRWGGSPSAIADLADWCLVQTEGDFGHALYYAVAMEVMFHEDPDWVLNVAGLDPKLIIEGYRDFAKHIGDSGRLFSWALLTAQAAGLRNEAASLLEERPGWYDRRLISPGAHGALTKWAMGDGPRLRAKTELHTMASTGHVLGIKRAIEDGADVDAVDDMGNTPLMYAAAESEWRAVDALLDAGATPDLGKATYYTALAQAVRHGPPGLVERLLDAGANPNLPRSGPIPTLFLAARRGDMPIVERLLDVDRINLDAAASTGATALFAAVDHHHVPVAKRLIEAGADVNLATNIGETPLVRAMIKNRFEYVAPLLEAGTDPNRWTAGRWTPLAFAARFGDAPSAQRLLELPETDVNLKNEFGWAPIHIAAEHGHARVIAVLAEHPDTDLDIRTREDSATPLMIAVTRGQPKAVEALIDAGADISLRSDSGQTALGYALEYNRKDIGTILREAKRKGD